MSQYLPYGGFKWGSKDVTKISDDSDKSYIIEWDLQYPEYLHNLHPNPPLGAENRILDGSKQAKLLIALHVFEKTMENIRKGLDIRLCCDAKKVEKLIAKPNFKGRTIFEEI
ncbi:uncharacterized protein TNCV_1769761 [Trichonephila clavipes]|nr:uncharacterized protein TNCV_1769761 [Trichonephila clavipes]